MALLERQKLFWLSRYGRVFKAKYKNMEVAVKVTNRLTVQEYDSMEDSIIREVSVEEKE